MAIEAKSSILDHQLEEAQFLVDGGLMLWPFASLEYKRTLGFFNAFEFYHTLQLLSFVPTLFRIYNNINNI